MVKVGCRLMARQTESGRKRAPARPGPDCHDSHTGGICPERRQPAACGTGALCSSKHKDGPAAVFGSSSSDPRAKNKAQERGKMPATSQPALLRGLSSGGTMTAGAFAVISGQRSAVAAGAAFGDRVDPVPACALRPRTAHAPFPLSTPALTSPPPARRRPSRRPEITRRASRFTHDDRPVAALGSAATIRGRLPA